MRVVTWNVNSVRARIDRVYSWLKRNQPDVVCLQEVKTTRNSYPYRELELAGYRSVVHGQKTYNGVAILSRHPIEDVQRGWTPGEDEDTDEARLIAATIQGVRIVSAYIPNGHRPGTEKFVYKLGWLERLRDSYLPDGFDPDAPLLVCGDFNVAPHDLDVHDPALWENTTICHPQVRMRMQRVLDFGLTDTFRHLHPEEPGAFTWWDYRNQALENNLGVRIDFILATDPMLARLERAWTDRDERAGQKPSDHAPVLAEFS